MSEKRMITLRMGDALFNAAILGFSRVMEVNPDGINYNSDENEISFDRDELRFFSQRYIYSLLERFKHQTPLAGLYRKLEKYRKYVEQERLFIDDEEDLTEKEKSIRLKELNDEVLTFSDSIIKKFESASYKAAFEILKQKALNIPFEDRINSIKRLKKEKKGLEAIAEITQLLDEIADTEVETLSLSDSNINNCSLHVKDYFLLKDIFYNNVNEFWNGIGFLHKQQNKADYVAVTKETFQDKALGFEPATEKKAGLHCSQCSAALTQGQKESMAWLNDMGVDIARKQSYFWNLSSHIALCPICKLVYACLPLGFSMAGKNGVFINSNINFSSLKTANGFQLDPESKKIYYEAFKELILNKMEKDETAVQENLQVLWRTDNKYKLNSFSPFLVKKLYQLRKEFQKIEKRWVEINGQTYSIFEETLIRVMNGIKLTDFIQQIFRHRLNEVEAQIDFVKQLIRINSDVFLKTNINKLGSQSAITSKGDTMKQKQEPKAISKNAAIQAAFGEGRKLFFILSSKNDTATQSVTLSKQDMEVLEKKIKSLSYRLLNAVSLRNNEMFIDSIVRQYLSLSLPVPEIIKHTLASEDDFIRIAQSFILGLNSPMSKETEQVEE